MHIIMDALVEGAIYMTTLRNVVMDYAGCNNKLTSIFCMGCQINYTSAFEDINQVKHCSSRKKWRFAYPYGGDLFIYMTCYDCAESDPRMVTDKNFVFSSYTEASAMGQEMSETSPEMNPNLYREQIVIWGPASNLVAIL